MKDNRSNIVVTAADLIDTISTLGNSISDRAHLLAVYCLDRVGSGNTVLFLHSRLHSAVDHQAELPAMHQNFISKCRDEKGNIYIATVQHQRQVFPIVLFLIGSENVRITCYDCLYIITTVWPVETYYMNSDVLNMTIVILTFFYDSIRMAFLLPSLWFAKGHVTSILFWKRIVPIWQKRILSLLLQQPLGFILNWIQLLNPTLRKHYSIVLQNLYFLLCSSRFLVVEWSFVGSSFLCYSFQANGFSS